MFHCPVAFCATENDDTSFYIASLTVLQLVIGCYSCLWKLPILSVGFVCANYYAYTVKQGMVEANMLYIADYCCDVMNG